MVGGTCDGMRRSPIVDTFFDGLAAANSFFPAAVLICGMEMIL